ncbi:MAG: ABC transporter ATP-binding protein [Leptospiraceae bacterium]|nr:ABC transporter ATP-binding protein [Leptospiraceae bacterium]
MQIDIKQLVKEYHGEGDTVRVLDGLDLHVARASVLSVEGASGEGKSTLLNIIGTVDKATSGEIWIDESELTGMRPSEKELFRAQSLGFIFQHHYLLPDFTVLYNVMMPLLIQRKDRGWCRSEATRILERVGLAHRLDHYPNQISGGEMARVGVARALVGGKQLILADEPTGNLDKRNSDKLCDLLWELQAELGFTLLIVTHDMDVAARVPLRYRLANGTLQTIG